VQACAVGDRNEKPDPCGSGVVRRRGGRQSPSRGEQLTALRLQSGRMGNRLPPVGAVCRRDFLTQHKGLHASHAAIVEARWRRRRGACDRRLEMPALRLRDQKVLGKNEPARMTVEQRHAELRVKFRPAQFHIVASQLPCVGRKLRPQQAWVHSVGNRGCIYWPFSGPSEPPCRTAAIDRSCTICAARGRSGSSVTADKPV
jgi:hypothetical protein